MTVAIVGQGWRTPLGRTVGEAVSRLLAGERAAIASTRTAGYACSVVAPILDEPAKSRQSRFLRRMGLFGLEVAHEAFAAAKQAAIAQPSIAAALADGNRVGLFAGVGGLRAHWDDMLKALEHQAEDGTNGWERGLRDVHPYWMLRHLSNNVHAIAAMDLGLRGEGATYGGATGGAQALAAAARALDDGAIDAALVVAYDSLLEPETLVELGARRGATLATDPNAIATAYHDRAAGFVPGEAAGAVVLVRSGDAPTGAVRIAVADGADGEREEPAPSTIARVLRTVLARRPAATPAGLDRPSAASPGTDRERTSSIAFVDGAARAWPDRDAAERAMLAELLSASTPLTAITASLGQLGAATTLIQAIALGELLRRGEIAPVASSVGPSAGPSSPSSASSPSTGPSSPSAGLSSPSSGPSSPSGGRQAIGLSTGAPGLCAAIRVDVAASERS